MKTDQQIQQDVMDQLKSDPVLQVSEIGVTVKNGVVTLSGRVDTYLKKIEAEKQAKKVSGVRAIAEDIQVGISPGAGKTDADIADAVLEAIKWHSSIPEDDIQVKVEEGVVTLEGEVEWSYQRESAKNAVTNFAGVRNVFNNIRIKPKATPFDLKQKINAAFLRFATIDSDRITVEVSGAKAILKGKVRSFAEKDEAEDAVWAAPGILCVENKIDVDEETEFTFLP